MKKIRGHACFRVIGTIEVISPECPQIFRECPQILKYLFFNFSHLFGVEFQEERFGFLTVEFRIVGFDAQEEAVH